MAAHPLHVFLVETAAAASTSLRAGVLCAKVAGATDPGWCGVDAATRVLAVGQEAQGLTTRAAVGVGGRIIDDVFLPESPCSLADLRQGDVGADALVLDSGTEYPISLLFVADCLIALGLLAGIWATAREPVTLAAAMSSPSSITGTTQ